MRGTARWGCTTSGRTGGEARRVELDIAGARRSPELAGERMPRCCGERRRPRHAKIRLTRRARHIAAHLGRVADPPRGPVLGCDWGHDPDAEMPRGARGVVAQHAAAETDVGCADPAAPGRAAVDRYADHGLRAEMRAAAAGVARRLEPPSPAATRNAVGAATRDARPPRRHRVRRASSTAQNFPGLAATTTCAGTCSRAREAGVSRGGHRRGENARPTDMASARTVARAPAR